jgi:hypothetical protein
VQEGHIVAEDARDAQRPCATRELVMLFFKDNDCKFRAAQRVKREVFGVAADGNLLPYEHPIVVELAALGSPEINCTLNNLNASAFYYSSPH